MIKSTTNNFNDVKGLSIAYMVTVADYLNGVLPNII